MDVYISYESRRECGYRNPGKGGMGIYLIGSGVFQPCERLPFPLEACPCCGGGIKPARGFTWIDPTRLFDAFASPACSEQFGVEVEGLDHDHEHCYLCNPAATAGDHAGLIWIGEKFYKTAGEFMSEAHRMGISRKLGALPTDFAIGKTVVYLAHRKTWMPDPTRSESWGQAVFTAFKPIRVDIVIDDPDDVPQRAVDLAEKLGDGARLVKVIPDRIEQGALEDEW